MSVDPLPTMHPSGEMWANTGYPISPEKVAFAIGAQKRTYAVQQFGQLLDHLVGAREQRS